MFIAFLASAILSVNFFLPEPSLVQPAGRNTIEGRVTTSEDRPLENVRIFLTSDYYGQLGQTYTENPKMWDAIHNSQQIPSEMPKRAHRRWTKICE
jgi:hypothetical protein